MSVQAFENGYWYATELAAFGKKLGLPAAHRMRKNELESAIKSYLATGRIPTTVRSKPLKKGVRDLDKGLSPNLPIENYTSNRKTKDFIRQLAERKAAGVKQKSGVWYRVKRGPHAQVTTRRPTYAQLVHHYIALNGLERFERIPYVCYVNFLGDYLAREHDASRRNAIAAWKQLKKMDVPKTYKA